MRGWVDEPFESGVWPGAGRLVAALLAVLLPIGLGAAYAAGHGWHKTAIDLARRVLAAF